jgi:hypothetical protein
MSEEQRIKEQCLQMAATEMEKLFTIIGDLGYPGYKIAMCRLKGYSYLQCAHKFGISKSLAQWYWNSCQKKGYDIDLKKIFNIKSV